MGIDLGRVQMVVTQDLLESPDIYAVLQHQGGGGVPELVGGILGAVQPGGQQVLFDQLLHRRFGDAFPQAAEEQGVFVDDLLAAPDRQIAVQGAPAGVVEVDHPLFVALAQDPQAVLPDIGQIESDKLGDPQAAVEE